jgi:hypothetical protein
MKLQSNQVAAGGGVLDVPTAAPERLTAAAVPAPNRSVGLGVHTALTPKQLARAAATGQSQASPGALFTVSDQGLLAALAALDPATKQLVVIDDFQTKVIPIDRNNTIPDISHGKMCALIGEKRLGRPAQRVDGGALDEGFGLRAASALQNIVGQAPTGGDPRRRLEGYVFSVSLAPRSPTVLSKGQRQFRTMLNALAAGGAQVYVAAGNEQNNDLARPRVRTIGASDGVQGFATIRAPTTKLIRNPGTDQIVNGQVLVKPAYEKTSGRLTGWSIGGGAASPFDFVPSEMADIALIAKGIEGRPLRNALMTAKQMTQLYVDLLALNSTDQQVALSRELGARVLDLSELGPALLAAGMGNPVESPIGLKDQRLYVSAQGVMAAMLRFTATPELVFFKQARNGLLQTLNNHGLRLLGPATSYATPFAAGEGAKR